MVLVEVGMPPEHAAEKFRRSLRLPDQFHAIWIRNEWDGDQIKHVIMIALRKLPPNVEPPEIPQSFGGYEIRKIKTPLTSTPVAPLELATPVATAPKYGR